MKNKILLFGIIVLKIFIDLMIIFIILLNIFSKTIYKCPYGNFKIKEIQTSLQLIALPGDGQNDYYSIIVNKFGLPVVFNSSRWSYVYSIDKIFSYKDSSIVYLFAMNDEGGGELFRYYVSKWVIRKTKVNKKQENIRIVKYYQDKLRGTWISELDTFKIVDDNIIVKKNIYPVHLIEDYYNSYNYYFSDSAKYYLLRIGFDFSPDIACFQNIKVLTDDKLEIGSSNCANRILLGRNYIKSNDNN